MYSCRYTIAQGEDKLKKLAGKFLFILFSVAAFHNAFSAPSSPETIIEIFWKEIQNTSTIPSEAEKFIGEALRQKYDFESFYKQALQDHWLFWTEAQKSEFDKRFEQYFLKSVAQKLNEIPKQGVGLHLEYKKIKKDRSLFPHRNSACQ